jgi:hypothetical protein
LGARIGGYTYGRGGVVNYVTACVHARRVLESVG